MHFPAPLTNPTSFFATKEILDRFIDTVYKHLTENPDEESSIYLTSGYFNLSGGLELVTKLIQEFPKLKIFIYLGQLPTAEQDQDIKMRHHDVTLPKTIFSLKDLKKVESLFFLLQKHSSRFNFYTLKSEDSFLHAKTMLFEQNDKLRVGVVGSMNLTYKGNTSNTEAAILTFDQLVLRNQKRWIDSLVVTNINLEMQQAYSHMARYQSLEDVYLFLLATVLDKDSTPEITPFDEMYWLQNLYAHQKDGALIAWEILQKYGGVLIGDEVGLGKTYIALALMKKMGLESKSTLIVVPTALKETWKEASASNLVKGEIIGYNEIEKVVENKLLMSSLGLIIFDESHWLRNISSSSNSKRSIAIRKLLESPKPAPKIALLTATPVNNKLQDLVNQLNLFIYDDILSTEKVPSLNQAVKQLENQNVSELKQTKIFTSLLSKIALIRTRKLLKEKYPQEVLNFPQETIIEKPTYEFDTRLKSLVQEIVQALEPDSSMLKLAVYRPSLFLLDSNLSEGLYEKRTRINEINNALIRLNLMKRLDSSIPAFISTLDKLCKKTEKTLNDAGQASSFTTLKVEYDKELLSNEDVDEESIEQDAASIKEDAYLKFQDIDIPRYIAALKKDLQVLQLWLATVTDIHATQQDPKLKKLAQTLVERVKKQAKNPKEVTRKTIIFTTDTDTAEYLYNSLYGAMQEISEDNDLATLYHLQESHIGLITGKIAARKKTSVLSEFNPPESSLSSAGSIDILITTDVLSEGANLQNADTVIHYNFPWNPMKALQRVGRIDRVKSKHNTIYSICFMPADFMESFIRLNQIIQPKLHKARYSTGLNTKSLDGYEALPEFHKELSAKADSILAGIVDEGDENEIFTNTSLFSEEYHKNIFENLTSNHYKSRIPFGAGALVETGKEENLLICLKITDELESKFSYYRITDMNKSITSHEEMTRQMFLSEIKKGLDIGNRTKTIKPFDAYTIQKMHNGYEQLKKDILENEQQDSNSTSAYLGNVLKRDLIDYCRSKRPADVNHVEYIISQRYPFVFIQSLERLRKTATDHQLYRYFIDHAVNYSNQSVVENIFPTKSDQIEVVAWVHFVPGSRTVTKRNSFGIEVELCNIVFSSRSLLSPQPKLFPSSWDAKMQVFKKKKSNTKRN